MGTLDFLGCPSDKEETSLWSPADSLWAAAVIADISYGLNDFVDHTDITINRVIEVEYNY